MNPFFPSSLTVYYLMVWLGLGNPESWFGTIAFALGGLVLLLAYSPLADRLASSFIPQPPNLQAFRAIQQSTVNLIAGIVIAWLLGGFLEELALRGVVVNLVRGLLSPWLGSLGSAAVGVIGAAFGAWLIHLYQGRRGAAIVAQLSLLFGLLYVASGYNLWAVMACHGLYDTIAFIRFATKKSKYAALSSDPD